MSSWGEPDYTTRRPAVLVAGAPEGRDGLRQCLHLLRLRQVLTPAPGGVAPAVARSASSLVPHRPGLRDGPTAIPLPSALETADLLIQHVFRLHGIPLDIVSDRGPQFVSRVWKRFCRSLGATASLTSGYHPQSNGQAERANQDLGAALRCPPSWPPTGTSRRCSRPRRGRWRSPLCSTTLSGPIACGRRPGLRCPARRPGTSGSRIVAGALLLRTWWDRRCGWQRGIFAWPARLRNWDPGLLDHSSSVDDTVNMRLHIIREPWEQGRRDELKWETNINSILKKTQQRMYFLQLLRKYGLP
ncbi:uncharacterized protein LOC127604950 [Hippocampus zosterae]|uniref:uncharacterized protein LOC127604950 n=1 Tax=Hippocampus zosterae TaxID=109293 RepID=UPI00223E7332|nr:uncharacterized protein LOC127604950 [Hippocampus zosterae]